MPQLSSRNLRRPHYRSARAGHRLPSTVGTHLLLGAPPQSLPTRVLLWDGAPFSAHRGNDGFKIRWEAGDSAVTVLRSEAAERRERADRRLAMQRVLVALWVLAVTAFAISAAQAHAAKEPQSQPPPLSTT